VESVYHRRVHSETGQTPLERFLAAAAGAPTAPVAEARLIEAFRWSETRTVSKTATVSLFGNIYEVEPELAGFRVQLVFDPHELAEIEVRCHDRLAGRAVPLEIRRHVHPRAQRTDPEKTQSTGIDYLGLVSERRERGLRKRIDYRDLSRTGDETNPTNKEEQKDEY